MILVLGIGGSFPYGFHISVINYPSVHIRKFINETWIDRYGSPLHPETVMLLWSFIVSVYGIGGFLGSLCCGYLTTKYRKKKCQMFTNLIMLVAALFMALSKTAKSFEMILVGRFLYGIGAGFSLNIHPQYVGEISPKKLRGFTNSTVAVFLTLGKLTGQVVGLREILGSEALWPWLLASSGLSALVQLVTLPFFPDSPSYLLIQKGNEEACRKGRVSAFLTYFPSPAVSQGEALQQRRQGRAVLGSITNLSKSMLLKQLRIVSQMQHLFSQVNFLFAFFRSTSILLKYSTQPTGATISVMVEIFSQSYRPSAFLIVGCINWMGLFVLGMIFPVIVVSDSQRIPLPSLARCLNTKPAQKTPRLVKEQQLDSGPTWPEGTPGLVPVLDCALSTPLNLNF
uniref:Uncharacterized protein n=1 Tax=Geospiza parvula TaxID=87175 RepID=A0A8U8B6V3_GEOPR